jgi:hypothetical protein
MRWRPHRLISVLVTSLLGSALCVARSDALAEAANGAAVALIGG